MQSEVGVGTHFMIEMILDIAMEREETVKQVTYISLTHFHIGKQKRQEVPFPHEASQQQSAHLAS